MDLSAVSDLGSNGVSAESGDMGFSKWLESLQGKPGFAALNILMLYWLSFLVEMYLIGVLEIVIWEGQIFRLFWRFDPSYANERCIGKIGNSMEKNWEKEMICNWRSLAAWLYSIKKQWSLCLGAVLGLKI